MTRGVYKRTEKHKKLISAGRKGKCLGNTNGFKKGCISFMKGKKHSKETRKKISIAVKKSNPASWLKGKKRIDLSRDKNPRWKNTPNINKSVRGIYEYKKWVSDVFKRDNWTCQTCAKRGVILEAHHIKSFALILKENEIRSLDEAISCKELWDINNGVSLCKECHKLTDNYKGKGKLKI